MEKIKRKYNLFKSIIGRLLGFDSGSFYLTHGKHEVFVPTRIFPDQVWVRIQDSLIDGCCQVPKTQVSYTTKCHGVLFEINVETEKCLISWHAYSI